MAWHFTYDIHSNGWIKGCFEWLKCICRRVNSFLYLFHWISHIWQLQWNFSLQRLSFNETMISSKTTCVFLHLGNISKTKQVTTIWDVPNWALAQVCSSKPMYQATELWLKSASSQAVSQLWVCMSWLKSGSCQVMTIEFGVAQFGRFGVVCLVCVLFCVWQWILPVGFQRRVSAFGFCCWKRCKSCLDLQES